MTDTKPSSHGKKQPPGKAREGPKKAKPEDAHDGEYLSGTDADLSPEEFEGSPGRMRWAGTFDAPNAGDASFAALAAELSMRIQADESVLGRLRRAIKPADEVFRELVPLLIEAICHYRAAAAIRPIGDEVRRRRGAPEKAPVAILIRDCQDAWGRVTGEVVSPAGSGYDSTRVGVPITKPIPQALCEICLSIIGGGSPDTKSLRRQGINARNWKKDQGR